MAITLDGTNGIETPAINAGNTVGQVAAFAMDTPPSGWLVANGAAVSRSTYSALFSVIGTVWGSGDGSTTFNLPDLRETAPVGIGTRGTTAPDTYTLAQFKNDQFQGHYHGLRPGANSYGLDAQSTSLGAASVQVGSLFGKSLVGQPSTGTNGAPRRGNTTRGKRVGVQYCVKF